MREVLALMLLVTAASAAEYKLEYLDEAPMTEEAFMATPEWSSATVKGKITAFQDGVIAFDTGARWENRWRDGRRNTTVSNFRAVGSLGYCLKVGGTFLDGREIWNCRVLRDGRVVSSDVGASGLFEDGPFWRGHGVVHVIEGKVQSASDDIPRY